jgi:hypothetical protein
VWKHGIIATDEGEVIAKPGMTPAELRATAVGSRGKFAASRDSPDYQTFWLGPMTIGGNECSAVAHFLSRGA